MPGKRKKPGKRSEPYSDCIEFKQILGQRVRGDKTYYKVEWKGQLLHTWELEENLSPQKVAEFKGKTRPARQSSSKELVVGFERGLEPDRILGMYEVDAALMFKLKWKGSSRSDFVPVDEAKLKCPQAVIEYYEKRIVWLEV